ncbi:CRISPR-associated endonuclease Cas2 [Streptosporangium saharense]|uniref:CRISPR-associated endoribonuclease Cas2 n=1 Tax=Streptosporangium saharense TaxID=1706840 RepID=A0A7W7VNT5_9ACTN|nr:CRISPR-associated endonuclease Cas2 [Streptosporangium saharense]MBB4917236.1 CRISPR-associated protein Cas2 [Streptosporangium saharense]
MFVIVVYDTLAERNPGVIKVCRQYLHWVQRSVFQGELSTAQHRKFVNAINARIDPSYDSVLIYRTQGPHTIQLDQLGQTLGNTNPVL